MSHVDSIFEPLFISRRAAALRHVTVDDAAQLKVKKRPLSCFGGETVRVRSGPRLTSGTLGRISLEYAFGMRHNCCVGPREIWKVADGRAWRCRTFVAFARSVPPSGAQSSLSFVQDSPRINKRHSRFRLAFRKEITCGVSRDTERSSTSSAAMTYRHLRTKHPHDSCPVLHLRCGEEVVATTLRGATRPWEG